MTVSDRSQGLVIACSRCGETKPSSEYYTGRRQCKTCVLSINQRYRQDHAVEIAAQKAVYTATDAYKQRRVEWSREWREKNRADISEKHKAWRKRNRDRLRRYRSKDPEGYRRRSREWLTRHPDLAAERARRWREENPEPYRLTRRNARMRRRALEKAAETVAFSMQQLRGRIAYYGGKCWICRSADYEQIDHVKPLSKGGAHILANLRPACRSCNRAKAARWLGTDRIQELISDVLIRSGRIRPSQVRG